MVRTSAWRSAAAALAAALALACTEQVTAVGHCPELCPADSLVLVDTVLTGIVAGDTSLRGFTRIDVGPILLASTRDSIDARPIMTFIALPQRWFPASADSAGVTIGRVDSVVLSFRMNVRDTTAHNTWLRLFHLPVTLDTTTTFDSVAAQFTAPFDSIQVPDSLRTADVRVLVTDSTEIATHWMPPAADSFRMAIGVMATANSPTAVILSSGDLTGTPPRLSFFVHGAAPHDTLTNEFDLVPSYDTYVQTPDPTPPAADAIVFGNQPAARSFIRFAIPKFFIDTASVVRATLVLTTTRAVTGIPGDTVVLSAEAILRYLDGKSVLFHDTSATGAGRAVVGQTTPVEIELAQIFHLWRGVSTDSLPRDITLHLASEDFLYSEIDAEGRLAGASAPYIRLSFVRPFRFGVP